MSRRLLRGSLLVLTVGLVLLVVSPNPSEASNQSDTFRHTIETNWDRWDPGHTGKLTAKQVNKLISDPTVVGSEAAALATIHLYLREHHHNKGSVTRAFLLAHSSGTGPKNPNHLQERRALSLPSTEKDPFCFPDTFSDSRSAITRASRVLFTRGDPRVDAIQQGDLGDCFLISTIGAAVQRNPALIRSLVSASPTGGYEVRFRTGKPIHVPHLTDAELALLSDSGQTGLWLNVLEKAYGQLSRKHDSKTRSLLAVDVLNDGGDATDVIPLLTGHRASTFQIRPGTADKKPAPSTRKLPALMDKVRRLLASAVAEQRLVCAGTDGNTPPPGLAEDHAYAVLGFKADVVELWNPWADNFDPKGKPGIEHGYPTRKGRFFMPLKDFVKVFEEVYYETERLAKKS